LYLNFKQFIRTADDKRNFPELVNKVAFVKKKELDGKEVKLTYLRKTYKTGPLPTSSQASAPIEPTEQTRQHQRQPSPPSQPQLDEKHAELDPRLAKHRQLILQHNQRVPSLESLNNSSKENIAIDNQKVPSLESLNYSSKENIATVDRNSNSSSPRQVPEPSFKKPVVPVTLPVVAVPTKRPLKASNSNMNSVTRELSGSCDTISSTGGESTASRESQRTRIDDVEKAWIRAITKNDGAKVKTLLEERVDLLDYRDYILGYTGAHWAVKTNNLKIMKMLLQAGTDINATSNNGGTLLHLAIQSGHFAIVKELTSGREHSRLLVDIRARDNAGRLPRHYVDEDKFESEEIDYMRRIIEPPRNDLPDIIDSSFSDRRQRHNQTKDKGEGGIGSLFRSVRKGFSTRDKKKY